MAKATEIAKGDQLERIETIEGKLDELSALHHLAPLGVHEEVALKEAVLGPINDLTAAVSNLVAGQSAFIAQQQLFMNFATVNNLIPPGPFLRRYYFDHPQEKDAIARFVTERFFSRRETPQRCFLQASTLALRLAYALDNDPTVNPHSLIHTNSAVAHLPLLYGNGNGRISIWPFCSRSFDPVCGGWQLGPGDGDAASYVRSLFSRANDALHTAILMPVYVTPHDGVFYERPDAAQFADVLSDAKEIVLLATGNCLVASLNDVPDDRKHNGFAALRNIVATQRSKITLVATQPSSGQHDLCEAFRGAFGTTHWCQPDGTWVQL